MIDCLIDGIVWITIKLGNYQRWDRDVCRHLYFTFISLQVKGVFQVVS